MQDLDIIASMMFEIPIFLRHVDARLGGTLSVASQPDQDSR